MPKNQEKSESLTVLSSIRAVHCSVVQVMTALRHMVAKTALQPWTRSARS